MFMDVVYPRTWTSASTWTAFCGCVRSTPVRAGPRSQQTPLSLAVIDVLNRHLETSSLRSVHGLAQAVPTVSRSQLYLLMRGQAVIDVAELFAVCEALGLTPLQVIAEAEAVVGGSSAGGGVRRGPPHRGRAGRPRGAVSP